MRIEPYASVVILAAASLSLPLPPSPSAALQQGHPLVTASGSRAYDVEDLESVNFNLTAAELRTLNGIKAKACWD